MIYDSPLECVLKRSVTLSYLYKSYKVDSYARSSLYPLVSSPKWSKRILIKFVLLWWIFGKDLLEI